METGKLYVVATPIGNLGDITYRAVEILKSSDLVICENPANSGKLFKEYGISVKTSRLYHSLQEKDFFPYLQKLQEGRNISLISDAGTPGISDPGSGLVRYLRENGIRIVPVPGASTLAAILSVSGFQTNPTIFTGFLSEKKNKKLEQLQKYENFEGLIVIYESVYKITQTLEMIKQVFKNSELLIGRELTKNFEEITSFKDISTLEPEKITQKGEFVLLINNFIKKIGKGKSDSTDKN